MAPKRRSQAARAAPTQQRTLSFQGKTTKLAAKASKESLKDTKKASEQKDDVTELEKEQETTVREPTTAEKAIQQQVEEETATLEAAPDPLKDTGKGVKTADVLGGKAKQDDKGAVGGKGAGWVADEETQARKLSDTQIKRYWRQKEQERIVPRVHQEDLTVYEKVLREFDMSGQFGVSTAFVWTTLIANPIIALHRDSSTEALEAC